MIPPDQAPALPRAKRNHNPLNIRCLPHGMMWAGQTGTDSSGGMGDYAIFADDEAGWACAYKLLLHYQQPKPIGHGAETIGQIIAIWAPTEDHNDPAGYAQQVSKATGIAVDAPINLTEGDLLYKTATAMAHVEANTAVWDDQPKRDALIIAGLLPPKMPEGAAA